jgi:hypothetical protein
MNRLDLYLLLIAYSPQPDQQCIRGRCFACVGDETGELGLTGSLWERLEIQGVMTRRHGSSISSVYCV